MGNHSGSELNLLSSKSSASGPGAAPVFLNTLINEDLVPLNLSVDGFVTVVAESSATTVLFGHIHLGYRKHAAVIYFIWCILYRQKCKT